MAETEQTRMNINELIPPSLRGKLIGGEKVTAFAVGLLIAAGVTAVGIYVAPIVIEAVTNLLYLGLLAGGAVIAVGVLGSHGFRSWVKMRYAMFIRRLHNRDLEKRPHEVVRYLLSQQMLSMQMATQKQARFNGSKQRLRAMLEKNSSAMERCRDQAEVAKKAGKKELAAATVRQLGRLDESTRKISRQYDLLVNLSKMLDEGLETARIKLRESEESMTLAIETNAAMADANATAQDMLTAIYGDKDKIISFTDAMGVIANQTAASLGSLEQIMHELSPVLADVELGRMVDEERGTRILAGIESQQQRLLTGKPDTIPDPDTAGRDLVMSGQSSRSSDLASLFETKK